MAALTAGEVGERLAAVRGRIERAGRDPSSVTVVAVTKGFGADAVVAAVTAGVVDIGENFAAELIDKAAAAPAGVRWHYLGAVQRRKVKRLAPHVHLWQGVHRIEEGAEIALRSPGAGVLVQVNVSGEARKQGCAPDDVDALVASLQGEGLDVRGLMAVGPTGPPDAARPGFRMLAERAAALGLREVSMGMTADVEVAVAEGSTMVRIGRALFGPRSPARQARR